MIYKTTIGGAIILNILFICLGIWINPYLFIVVGVNSLLMIVPIVKFVQTKKELNYSNKQKVITFIMEECEKQNDNSEFLIASMIKIKQQRLDKVLIHFGILSDFGVDWVFSKASERLRNDKEFVMSSVLCGGLFVATANIGETLKQDDKFINEAKTINEKLKGKTLKFPKN